MSSPAPWECHPDLTEERLGHVAQFFANTRRELVADHDPSKGDDSWSLGCRGNAWWRNRLLTIALRGDWPWLSVIGPGKRFIFNIGRVPVRFYRGKVDRPPSSTLAYSDAEVRQLSFAFEQASDYADLKWRFIVETGLLGEPTKVIFAGLEASGAVVCYWEVPFVADVVKLPAHSAPIAESVELPAPSVTLPRADGERAADAS